MTIKVYTMDMIQYIDDKANMVTIMAKSHFRDRVLSPLVLLHHEILREQCCGGIRMKASHRDVDKDGEKAKIYT